MKEDLNPIGSKLKHPALRDSAGIGYIIIPNNLTVAEYLEICLRNSSATIITGTGEVIKNIYVVRSVWNEIEFPKDQETKGSAVIWVNIPNTDNAVIVGVINKADQLNKSGGENTFNFERSDINETSARITGNGDIGKIDIFVTGKMKGESEISIKVLNDDEEGVLKVYVQGDVIIESENDILLKAYHIFNIQIVDEIEPDKQTNISYELTKGFIYNDEFGNSININKDGIVVEDINKNKIKTSSVGIEMDVDGNRISLKKEVAGILFRDKTIKIDKDGIVIEAGEQDIEINSGDNVIQMNDSGINIDSPKKVFINGSNNVLYSKIPGLTEIIDVKQIGVSNKVKVG